MQGRVLGIDIGLKRTGLALSDETRLTVRALPFLSPKSRLEDIEFILSICLREEVKDIVIGYPLLPQSGEEGMMARRVRGFAEALKREAHKKDRDVNVYLLDESYTSAAALKHLHEQGVKKKNIRKSLDGEVACMLVEEYIRGPMS